ncbi:MAG TPA: shikimate kinase [Acidimicrobiales bacterium]|nr:shikimate kinase [Acidimicrobiales bacterium]
MSRLVLVGLPGVGKSSVAQTMAQRWGCEWVDTDDVIARLVERSAADFLREAGEPAFRQQELLALYSSLGVDNVVATGGGVVTTPEGRRLLSEATTIWLDCADEVILSRIVDGDRPLLQGDPQGGLTRLRREREAWYRAVSLARIEASGTLEDVSTRIEQLLAEVKR